MNLKTVAYYSIFTLIFFTGKSTSTNQENDIVQHEQKYRHSPNEILLESQEKPVLYAPGKEKYLQEKLGTQKKESSPKPKRCPFCFMHSDDQDEKNLVLARFRHCMIMLSLYPYSRGHLVIAPYMHANKLFDLPDEVRNELMFIINASSEILEKVMGADGVNVGINIGKVAGASVPDHIHIQIVPRSQKEFRGFLEVAGQTSVITWSLNRVYTELSPIFQDIAYDKTEKPSYFNLFDHPSDYIETESITTETYNAPRISATFSQ